MIFSTTIILKSFITMLTIITIITKISITKTNSIIKTKTNTIIKTISKYLNYLVYCSNINKILKYLTLSNISIIFNLIFQKKSFKLPLFIS